MIARFYNMFIWPVAFEHEANNDNGDVQWHFSQYRALKKFMWTM